jgi:hypothetical protein
MVLMGATVGFGHSVDPSWFTWPFRVLVVALGLVLLTLYTASRYVTPLRRSTTTRTMIGVDPTHVDELQRLAKGMATVTQVKIFTAAVLRPVTVRQRVNEHYVPGQRTLRQAVRVEARVPNTLFKLPCFDSNGKKIGTRNVAEDYVQKNVLYLPILVPSKGVMLDGFALRGPGGEIVPALSYTEYLRLVACVLRTLLLQAYGTDFDQLPEEARRAEHAALSAVMRRGSAIQPPSLSYLTRLQAPHPVPLQVMVQLVGRLSTHYALVAAVHCDSDQRVLVEYERVVIPAMRLASARRGWVQWLKDRLRLLLGARPIDLTVSLDNASTCQSYHLTVESAEGLYLADQKAMIDMESYLRERPNVLGAPPYYRFRRRLGQSHAHFYARFFPGPEPGQPSPTLRLTYFEIPPGSVFRAMVTSVAAAVLVWLVGLVISANDGHELGTDIPALLLAFPAVVAAWMGFEAPSRRLLEATLAARISLIITAMTSIAASGLFMVYRADLHHLHGVLPDRITFLGITQTSWSIVAALALSNASATLYACLVRTWEFSYLSSRVRNEKTAEENG